MPRKRLQLPLAMLAAAFCSTSCTLTKPLVCAISTPAYVLGNSSSGCGCDARAAVCGIAVVSAVGAAGGLITGLISDINCLTGQVDDPIRNIHDPFATNLTDGPFR